GERFMGLFQRRQKRSGILMTSLCTQLIIVLVLGLIIFKLTPFGMGSFLLAAALWIWVLCFTPAFDLWFIQPKANTAVVLANALKREQVLTTNEELTKLQPSNT